jgi:hypothetical protein
LSFRPTLVALVAGLHAVLLSGQQVFCQTIQSDPPLYRTLDSPFASLQDDGISNVPVGSSVGIEDRSQLPSMVELAAGAANFDHDKEMDGWRANLLIRDAADRVVSPSGTATIELWTNSALVGSSGEQSQPIARWVFKLQFDSDGVVRVKLPMPSPPFANTEISRASGHFSNRRQPVAVSFIGDARRPVLVTSPQNGVLWVKVVLDSGISLEAAERVIAIPSTLVDIGGNVR